MRHQRYELVLHNSAYERKIDATDRQLYNLVYELYGSTEEEIGIVEGSE